MKKIGILVICLVLICILPACSSYDMKDAKLEDYEDDTFLELLEKYAEETAEEEFDEDADVSYEIEYEKGWDMSDHLDSTDLIDGEIAVTYSIMFDADSEDGEEKVTVGFFGALYKKTNTIRIEGLYMDADGDVDEYYDNDDIEDIIEHIF